MTGCRCRRTSPEVAVAMKSGLARLALLCVVSGSGLVTASVADAALTWQQLGPDTEVNVVAVAPATGDTILVSAYEGFARQMYRTDDAGQTWEPVVGLTGIDDIAVDPRHPRRMYAAGGSVFRSVDGGVTWNAATADIDAGVIALDPSCGRRLCVGSPWGSYPFSGRVYRSDDWGATWVDIGPEPPLNLDEGVSDIVVDPSDSNTIYFGTFDYEFGGTGVYKTSDGGATWECLGWPGESHPPGQIYYVSRLHISHEDPDRLIAGSGVFNFGVTGAVYETADGGADWNTLVVSGITDITYLTTLALEPLTQRRDTVFIGVDHWGGPDEIHCSLDSGRGWHTLVAEILDDSEHGTDIATDGSSRIYYTTGSGVVRSSVPSEPEVVYWSHSVYDSLGGDGDGHVDPGETVSLDIELRCLFGNATSVDATLSSDDVFVTISQDYSPFPDITWGGVGASLTSYEMSVSPDRPPGPVELTLDIAAANWISTEVFYVDPRILLVDDDDFEDYEVTYEDALDESHLAYRTWSIVPQGPVTAEMLFESDAVIWFSSDMSPGERGTILSAEEEGLLSQYLDQGGRFFLSSQDYLSQWFEGSEAFASVYLHVNSCFEDRSYLAVEGVGGDPIGDGLSFDPLQYTFSNLSDALFPDSLAARVMNVVPGVAAAAIRYPSIPDTADFRTVFFGFPLEAVPAEGEPPNTRASLLRRIVEWLVPEGGLTPTGVQGLPEPPQSAGNPTVRCSPNPARGSVQFDIASPCGGDDAVVSVYSVDGRRVWGSRIAAPNRGGIASVTWDGRTHTGTRAACGVYMVRVSVAGRQTHGKIVLLE